MTTATDANLHQLSMRWLTLPHTNEGESSRHLLRRRFDMVAITGHAHVAITASSVYRLYVNGALAMVGPMRGTAHYLFVDRVDVSHLIRTGWNVIAAEVDFHPNLVPRVLQHEWPFPEPGVGLCMEIDGDSDRQTVTLDEHWSMTPLTGFDPTAIWARGQRSELLHAEHYPRAWMTPGYDDARWSRLDSHAIGDAPAELRPRPTPLPLVADRRPTRLIDAGWLRLPDRCREAPIPAAELDWFGGRDEVGKAITESRHTPVDDLDRVQHAQVCEAISGGGMVGNPHGPLHPQGGPLRLHGSIEGDAYAVYDLGEVLTGLGYIEATIPVGTRLDVSLLEWLDVASGGPGETRGRVGRVMCGYGGFTIEGDGQRLRFDSLLQHNFRYVCVTARHLSPGQSIEVHLAGATEVCALHRAQVAADVVCSDPVLNRIVEATKQTIRVTSHDVFASGGTHERVVTAGDCLQSSEAGRLFFGDVGRALSEATFDLFVDQGPRGVPGWMNTLSGRAGGDSGGERERIWPLAPCMLFIDMMAWAREGCELLPQRYLDAALGMARDTTTHLCPEGLIEVAGVNNWTDWSKMVVGERQSAELGVNIAQNAYFYRMFDELAQMHPEESRLTELATTLRHGLRAIAGPRIASPDHRVTRFVPDMYVRIADGRLVPFEVKEANVFGGCTVMLSETTQYWLLWSGALTDAQEQRLWEVLRDWRSFEVPLRDNTRMLNPARSSSVMGLCPRFKYARQRRDPVIYRDARDAFGPNVLRENVLWESLELDSRAVVHPTTPYVGKALYECLTGILPGDHPGEVRIEPVLDSSIEWARGYQQLRSGLLGVSWRYAPDHWTLHVGLPGGMTARVKLPEPLIGLLVTRGHRIPADGVVTLTSSATITVSMTGLNVKPHQQPDDDATTTKPLKLTQTRHIVSA